MILTKGLSTDVNKVLKLKCGQHQTATKRRQKKREKKLSLSYMAIC